MKLLKGKKILITGITNERSIAWGIAKILYKEGAELGCIVQNKKIRKKIKYFIEEIKPNMLLICDVSNDQSIKKLFIDVNCIWKNFDGLVHSIAYCPKEQLSQDIFNNITRSAFNTTHEISSYSFLAMIKECRHMLNKNSSLVTLSYIGSQKVISHYHLMGLAKASLESNVRYLASILGEKCIRVNAISSGPIKTTSSYIIKDFNKFKKYCESFYFIKKDITSLEIGNVTAFLSSDLSNGITGSIIYVDHGFHASRINSFL
ncbi:enoyl-ACP reductase FabI [Buchnera aphidicola]|uniref:enoyl-ACP reductase FabI n=1 Tax=Buchnera aphidicola TaxID=9 RepID=UPI003BEF3844